MQPKIIIVLDCGATNVRAVAIDENENLLAQKAFANTTHPDPFFSGGLIWDAGEIWDKLCKATQAVIARIDKKQIAGVTVTTFGVDFAPVKKSGEMLYPVISWACRRTEPVMDNIGKYISPEKLFSISGVNTFSFNTINKLVWFKENKPAVLDNADHYLFMPSLLIWKMTGEFVTDTTMAGTSMLTDLRKRDFSPEIFHAIGVENKFPSMVEPGTVVGKIHGSAAAETGLPSGTPVIAAGHDTQFAVLGAGARKHEVVLSSGTWEILMARTSSITTNETLFRQKVTVETDAVPGLYNPGLQWLGSGILEWIKRMFYTAEMQRKDIYDLMIAEAEKAENTTVGTGIDFLNESGIFSGLGIRTKRADIYRATLEALAQKTKESLKILEQAGSFTAGKIIVVGGGSKNKLWNRLREQATGIPVETAAQPETTVLGAARIARTP